MHVLRCGERGEERSWSITGFTCMEDDVMHRGYRGPLAVGDICLFSSVGAYSNVLRPPFIEPPSAMYAFDGQEIGEPIRRADTFDDIFGAFGPVKP